MHLLEGGRAVTSNAGITLDILVTLPRLSSGALRKIADECERMIRERMEDGVFE